MRRLTRMRQRGVSLIETLVTLLVLSVGLIGLASLQNRTLQFNQDAQLRSLANILLDDMAERCRSTQTADAVFSSEREHWQQYVGASLPGGTGSAELADDECSLEVSWSGRRFLDDAAAATDSRERLQLHVKLGDS